MDKRMLRIFPNIFQEFENFLFGQEQVIPKFIGRIISQSTPVRVGKKRAQRRVVYRKATIVHRELIKDIPTGYHDNE